MIAQVDIALADAATRTDRAALEQALAPVRAEFAPLALALDGDAPDPDAPHVVAVDLEAWRALDYDPTRLDAALRRARGARLALRIDAAAGEAPAALAGLVREVLTRAQRLIDLRNAHARAPWFDRALAAHRALHDLSRPLVAADYDHAIDAWRWVTRLAPDAGPAVQLAALFHDIERLRSEADVRIEHHAADYQAFKDAHARGGAAMARDALAEAGVEPALCARVAALIDRHERPGDDPELLLLNDADALSFFSLNACGFADYYGPAHTRRKVAYSLRRMRPAARARLSEVRHRRDVAAILAEELPRLRAEADAQEGADGPHPRSGAAAVLRGQP